MAIEYHIKFDGVKGESGSSKHKDEHEIHSWNWGSTNPTSISGSGLSAGKVSIHDITISKPTDKGSAKLLELCCTGKHIATATLTCSKSTGDKSPADYLTIKLNEVHIASFQTGGSTGEEIGSESITLAFLKFEYDYKVQGKDGTLSAAGTVKGDLGTREYSS